MTFLVEFKNKIENDVGFWENGLDFNLNTLEYVLFTVAKSKYASDCLKTDTISVLNDIYKFYKFGNFKKKAMSLLPFIKVDGKNITYYRNCVNQLNKDLKELQFNYSNIIFHVVEKVITEEQLKEIAEKTRNEIENIKELNAKARLLIEKADKENESLEAKIDFNKDAISKKAKEIFESQNSTDSIIERLNKGIEEETSKNKELLSEQSSMLEQKTLSKEKKISEKENLTLENKTLSTELVEIKKAIEEFEFNSADLINNYEAFVDRYNIDLTDINRKIDKFNSAFERIDSKIQSMINNGWGKARQ